MEEASFGRFRISGAFSSRLSNSAGIPRRHHRSTAMMAHDPWIVAVVRHNLAETLNQIHAFGFRQAATDSKIILRHICGSEQFSGGAGELDASVREDVPAIGNCKCLSRVLFGKQNRNALASQRSD